MKTGRHGSIAAARRLAGIAAALLLALLTGCASAESRISVNSNPSGARILIDGVDSGRQTPSSLILSTQAERYEIRVEKAGYNPVARAVRLGTDVDVMDANEAVCTICISPCCCFLPLLNFLSPVDVTTRFRPSQLDFELEIAGQGARLELVPKESEVYLDGKLVALLDGNYLVTDVGTHELEVRAAGHRAWSRTIRVDESTYQRLKVELEVEGQGLLLVGEPEGAKVYVDDQFQGTLAGMERRLRLEPGPHLLRVEADGHVAFQDVVQVAGERYHEIEIALKLDGQGVIVRKPEGLSARTPQVQVFVDGQLAGSGFDTAVRTSVGEHDVEVRVEGHETHRLRVKIDGGQFIDVLPGGKVDANSARKQAQIWGIRMNAPAGLGNVAPEDVQIRIGDVLVGQQFGEVIEPAFEGDIWVEVRIHGYRAWKDRVVVSKSGIIDLYPKLEKE
ncbi:MAG: PEGA domain-containing protein [Planctomycetes bacterium]|nr:PEGA domain-containing protein [Planctomycetota bacterium]